MADQGAIQLSSVMSNWWVGMYLGGCWNDGNKSRSNAPLLRIDRVAGHSKV